MASDERSPLLGYTRNRRSLSQPQVEIARGVCSVIGLTGAGSTGNLSQCSKTVCVASVSLSLFPPLSSAVSVPDCKKFDVYLLLDYGQVTHNLHMPLFPLIFSKWQARQVVLVPREIISQCGIFKQ